MVRVPQRNPFLGQQRADLADVTIERGGSVAATATMQLFRIEQAGIRLELVDEVTGKPPQVEPSSQMRVTIGAFSSFAASGEAEYLAYGRTPVFSCAVDKEIEVPLYVGPADGVAATSGEPLANRQQATATVLADGRVLILGGVDENDVAVTPAVTLYDHRTGVFCAEGGECLPGARASGGPGPLVGHTATRLADGSVLVLGGRRPGQSQGGASAYRFDPDTLGFTALTFAGDALAPRHRHLAVLLDGFNVKASLQGQVLIIGGCRGPCGPGEIHSDALLLNVEERTVARLSAAGSYDGTAVLLSSGKVLVAGGRDTENQLSASAWLFSTESETFEPVNQGCPGSSVAGLCAARAAHVALALDDGNVLLYGGDLASVGAGAPPIAEVFMLVDERSVPLSGATDSVSRVGHSLTRLACRSAPCPVLVVGGQDPAVPSAAAGPALLWPPQRPLPTEYVVRAQPLEAHGGLSSRAWHLAAVLDDGTVLVSGGRAPNTGMVQRTATIFSPCERSPEVACPFSK